MTFPGRGRVTWELSLLEKDRTDLVALGVVRWCEIFSMSHIVPSEMALGVTQG